MPRGRTNGFIARSQRSIVERVMKPSLVTRRTKSLIVAADQGPERL
jgi:hypothetical protein